MNEQEMHATLDTPEAELSLSILCVDDEENILKSLRRLFQAESLQVITAGSGKEALTILGQTPNIGVIVSDYRMPEMNGTAFLREASQLVPDTTRMILTGYADMNAAIVAINEGGVHRFLTKPWNESELLQAVQIGLQRYRLIRENQRLNEVVKQQKNELAEWNANLKQRVLQQTATIRKQLEDARQQSSREKSANESLVSLLSELLEQRHQRLSRHSRTVAALVQTMLCSLDLPQSEKEEIRQAALLHDIGLIGTSDRVLAKHREHLSNDEIADYRLHPVKGQETLDLVEELRGIAKIIRHHHEQFDGNGFPDGLAGENIPLGSRIIALASFIENTYVQLGDPDAKYQVTRKVSAGMGGLFDPELAPLANLAIKEDLLENSLQRRIVEDEISFKDLKAGMVMTRDIYTSHGVLVVERGTRLTSVELDSIHRHHLSIPLTTKAYVQKSVVRG